MAYKGFKVALICSLILAVGSFLNANASKAASDETIKIGAGYPLSGYLSWLGEYYKKAASLEVTMINESGGVEGKKVEIIFYDDQSSAEEAVRIARRMISKDKVIAITGTSTVPITGAVSSLANKEEIPATVHSGYDLNPEKEPYTFNTAHPTFFAVARPFMQLKKEGISKVALFMPMGALGDIGIKNAKKAAEKYGLTLIGTERFDIKAPDVTAPLTKVRALDPEAIFSFATGEPAALVARNMAQLGIKVPLIVSHGNATPGFLRLASDLPVRILVPTGKIMAVDSVPEDDPCKDILINFSKLHQKEYNEPPNYFSGLAADAVALICEGVRKSGSMKPSEIRDGIESISNFPRLGGVYNMSSSDHYGVTIEDMIVITIKNGHWQLVQ
jgi:branched-chain amino acid transport system substrate-binding protein